MVLILFKNIHIWLSYGQKWHAYPYLGIRFFGRSRDYDLSIGSMINLGYDAYFSLLIFRPLLAEKWAWPPHAPLMCWGLKTRPKSWPTG